MDDLEIWREYLMFLIPLIVLAVILMVTALINIIKNNRYRFGNKITWIIIVILVQVIGPIIYFVFGRGED